MAENFGDTRKGTKRKTKVIREKTVRFREPGSEQKKREFSQGERE